MQENLVDKLKWKGKVVATRSKGCLTVLVKTLAAVAITGTLAWVGIYVIQEYEYKKITTSLEKTEKEKGREVALIEAEGYLKKVCNKDYGPLYILSNPFTKPIKEAVEDFSNKK